MNKSRINAKLQKIPKNTIQGQKQKGQPDDLAKSRKVRIFVN